MKGVVSIDERKIVRDPLWNLMLFTNDCYPGCSCDNDFFDMTVVRVEEWINQNGERQVQQTLAQIDEILSTSSLNVEDLSDQTNYPMENKDDAIAWLSQWRSLLVESSKLTFDLGDRL